MKGQFAETAYSVVPIQLLLENFSTLSRPRFPLEHHDFLKDAVLVNSFCGSFADLPVHVMFRPSKGQLVVSISGTSPMKHVLHDLRVMKSPHPSGHGSVHTGFWAFYQGIRSQVLGTIREGIAKHSPSEITLTGHSMGGSVVYLLCIDLLADQSPLLSDKRLKIVVFGCPRPGDVKLAAYFRSLVAAFQNNEGSKNTLKGYNDGKQASNSVLMSEKLSD